MHIAQHKVNPEEIRCAKYNVCFGHLQQRRSLRKASVDIRLSSTSNLKRLSNPQICLASNNTSIMFFEKAKSRKMKKMQQIAAFPTEMEKMSYVKSSFPQRKPKTNDQVLLNLLLKLAERSKKSSFCLDNRISESTDGMRPVLKAKTRMNWMKSRYSPEMAPSYSVEMNKTFRRH